MRFLLLLFIFTIQKFVDANLSLQCIVSYLNSRNASEDIFSSVDEFSGTEAECESFIRIKIADFNEKILEKMEEESNVRPLIDCFRHETQSEEYEIITLKLQGVGMLDVGWKFWRNSAKEARYEELKKEIDDLGSKIMEQCAAVDHYGKFFDTTLEKHPPLYSKGETEYCLRRYLVEKYLIDSFRYNFKINPKNVTMENYNCDLIMRDILEPAYENLKKDETECSWNVLKEHGYYDQLLKIELLSKLTLTIKEKATERQKFIDAMFEINKKTREC
ncbi:uncharacterized protein [Chironomus tepperi]|uniref:uncharacterized protein n=1 Tax=Chironomus tepperi TaxID=113505 RepID=UPI00391F2B7D